MGRLSSGPKSTGSTLPPTTGRYSSPPENHSVPMAKESPNCLPSMTAEQPRTGVLRRGAATYMQQQHKCRLPGPQRRPPSTHPGPPLAGCLNASALDQFGLVFTRKSSRAATTTTTPGISVLQYCLRSAQGGARRGCQGNGWGTCRLQGRDIGLSCCPHT